MDEPIENVDVTIAIPCYEQAHFLVDALRSVVNQTVAPKYVIVVDDGSTEPHANAMQDLCREFKVSYMRVTNRGLPSARNAALLMTSTEGFVPLDADDWLEPQYLEKMFPLLKTADVVVPGLQEHGPERNKSYMPGFDRPLGEVTLDVMWEFNRTFYCSLFRTSLLKRVGGYNGRMVKGFEDYDLAIDLMTRGARYVACDEILFNYRTRAGSMLSTAMAQRTEIMAEMHRHHGR